MEKQEAVTRVIKQFTKYNPTLVNAVNKGATTKESFKEDVYSWMEQNDIPTAYRDDCYEELSAAVWNYDILKPLIYDDGAISDIACHSWDNVWIQVRGRWKQNEFSFRDEEHFIKFFRHVCRMNNMTINERNASDNCTDITTCPDFRLRLNFVHHSINTGGSDIFSIRKIPTQKKTLQTLSRPEEGMVTEEMIPIIQKHLREATGVFIVGMGGSGKTTFLNALIEELPEEWKFLFIQENEELFSDTRKNSDFLKTVKGINQYDVSHDLKELARNGLLMSIKCFVIGEIKGDEAMYLFNVISTGAVGMATLHASSAAKGLDKACDYIKYASDYSKDQCMEMLTVINKVFFLEKYRLREIVTVNGYDSEKHKLLYDIERYDEH